ncbi:hypothetical protein [Streptomyces sp. NRRL F-2890]|uniref:hypothetical protein n=1 Tax=Streptomyces sp. NRRL F-2890 TaxID=1463845 RepID=UPI00131A5991|nr:hypothetical protein [Streptomyces sp. NRRL F-2890]
MSGDERRDGHGWFSGQQRADFYFEEVTGDVVIWPAATDERGRVYIDVAEDVEAQIDGVIIDGRSGTPRSMTTAGCG